MNFGIIGAGQIGGTLTRRLTDLGHEVFVANSRGPDTLSGLAAETGATAVSAPACGTNQTMISTPNMSAFGRTADMRDPLAIVRQ